ncbi:hypothetical protein BU15DRAFT_58971 [Melanogaster broomeanus]|nr:hypothetical protein BU15DRAFT_58971 [Melanogaster broomeanus]
MVLKPVEEGFWRRLTSLGNGDFHPDSPVLTELVFPHIGNWPGLAFDALAVLFHRVGEFIRKSQSSTRLASRRVTSFPVALSRNQQSSLHTMISVSNNSNQYEFTFIDVTKNGTASKSPPPIPSIHLPGYFPTGASNPPIPLGPDVDLGDDFISSIDWSDPKVISLVSSMPLPPTESVPLTGSACHTSHQHFPPYTSSESPSCSDGTTMPASQLLTLSRSDIRSLSTSPALPPPHVPSPTPIPEHQRSSSHHGNPSTLDDSDEPAFSQQANSSTWQARNPGQPVIQPRVAPPRQTAAQKASRDIARAQKAAKAKLLYESIEAFLKDQRSKTETLARQHDVTVDHVRQLIGGETHYHTSRKIQLRNALVHAKAVEVNTVQLLTEIKVARWVLNSPWPDIQRMVQEDLKTRTLTCEEEEEYITNLAEHRDVKVHGVRANNTAASRDVLVTVDRIATEANLVERDSLSNMRKQVTRYISDGLSEQSVSRKITGKRDIAMNYLNYDVGIVQAYDVQLVNWPEKVKFGNPSTIGTVSEIAGTCTWKKLTRRELDAHSAEVTSRMAVGDVVKKTRKKRTETRNASAQKKLKGPMLRMWTVPKSVAFLPDNVDDDTEEEEEEEEE